jgi:hypothetical protein
VLTQVRMLKAWGNNVKGDLASFDPARAAWLVENRFAEDPAGELKPAPPDQEVDPALEVHGLTDRSPETVEKAPTGPQGHKMVTRGRTKGAR